MTEGPDVRLEPVEPHREPLRGRGDLIRNPRTCNGSWPYQVRLRYSQTDESVRDGSVACTK